MPILLKIQVERTAKTPIQARRARVGGLCDFQDTVERVPTGSTKTGRCADVRECPAELQHRSRGACGRLSAEGEAASGEAGESQGVVRAPWQTHLPAVRAVWGFRAGVVERAKTAPLGSEAQIITLFQGKQRGHTQNWREISMANRKIKFPLWLMPETKADTMCWTFEMVIAVIFSQHVLQYKKWLPCRVFSQRF